MATQIRWLKTALKNFDDEVSYIASDDPAGPLVVRRIAEAVALLATQQQWSSWPVAGTVNCSYPDALSDSVPRTTRRDRNSASLSCLSPPSNALVKDAVQLCLPLLLNILHASAFRPRTLRGRRKASRLRACCLHLKRARAYSCVWPNPTAKALLLVLFQRAAHVRSSLSSTTTAPSKTSFPSSRFCELTAACDPESIVSLPSRRASVQNLSPHPELQEERATALWKIATGSRPS